MCCYVADCVLFVVCVRLSLLYYLCALLVTTLLFCVSLLCRLCVRVRVLLLCMRRLFVRVFGSCVVVLSSVSEFDDMCLCFVCFVRVLCVVVRWCVTL